MTVIDRIPLTNMRCARLVPDPGWQYPDTGANCQFVTDDEREMFAHQGRHDTFENTVPGYWWDNCAVCRHPIRLTSALVLRAHGHPARRCPGGGQQGTFMRRCGGLPPRIES